MKRLVGIALFVLAVCFGNAGLSSAADRLPYWAGHQAELSEETRTAEISIKYSPDGKKYYVDILFIGNGFYSGCTGNVDEKGNLEPKDCTPLDFATRTFLGHVQYPIVENTGDGWSGGAEFIDEELKKKEALLIEKRQAEHVRKMMEEETVSTPFDSKKMKPQEERRPNLARKKAEKYVHLSDEQIDRVFSGLDDVKIPDAYSNVSWSVKFNKDGSWEGFLNGEEDTTTYGGWYSRANKLCLKVIDIHVANYQSQNGLYAPLDGCIEIFLVPGKKTVVGNFVKGPLITKEIKYFVIKSDLPEGKIAFLQHDSEQRLLEKAKQGVSGLRVETRLKAAIKLAEKRERTVLSEKQGTLAVSPQIEFGDYHALVIGNNNYKHLPKLENAIQDARDVSDVLMRLYGFKVQRIENASRSDIIGALVKLRSELQWDSNLLVYYAGHGTFDDYTSRGYWQPVEAEEDNLTNWIANTTITDMLRAIQAKHVMVVADSCYSGTLVRSAQGGLRTAKQRDVWVQRALQKRSRTALVSGGFEPVQDGGGGKNSIFAKALLTVLSENQSVIDGAALFNGLKRQVVLGSEQTPQYSDIRNAEHDGGEFFLVRRATSKKPQSAPETADPLEALEKRCSALGFKKGTEKHGDCVMKLFR